jgi:integrase
MKAIVPLTDTAIRNVKPGDSRKRLSDGNGLYLLLFVKGGSHCWRFDYTIDQRRKTISLGKYPDTSLKLAREKAVEARQLVAAGVDPSEKRKKRKAAAVASKEADVRIAQGLPPIGSFEEVARRWFIVKSKQWSEGYAVKVIARLENDVFPWIGTRPIGTLTPPEILTVLRRIESRGVIETAHRARESCGQVFRFAVAEGIATSDPTRDLKDALSKPISKPMAAIVKPDDLAPLLRAIYGYQGTLVVRTALRLAPMLMLRPGELRFAKWSEIDLGRAEWWVPAYRMKRELQGKLHGEPHFVPLSRQAVELLRELFPLTGRSPDNYVFRGARDHKRAMSENTINGALRSLGYDTQEVMTGHGFRATARTMLEEILGYDPVAPEAQLAHTVKEVHGRAYNRTEFLFKRRNMLQDWANYLDRIRLGCEVGGLRIAA